MAIDVSEVRFKKPARAKNMKIPVYRNGKVEWDMVKAIPFEYLHHVKGDGKPMEMAVRTDNGYVFDVKTGLAIGDAFKAFQKWRQGLGYSGYVKTMPKGTDLVYHAKDALDEFFQKDASARALQKLRAIAAEDGHEAMFKALPKVRDALKGS